MPELTIKDLPDTSKINDKETYLLRGVHWRAVVTLIGLLWRGENIGKGYVSPQQNGDSGYFFKGPSKQPQIPGTGGGTANVFPLQPGADASTNSDPKYTITYGTWAGSAPTISGTALVPTTASNVITFGPTDTYAYVQCDFTYYTSTGVKTITDRKILTGSGALPANTISGGSGTVYQELFGVTITAPVGSGPYTIVAAPSVNGSQNFDVCLTGPSINGAYLI